MLYAASAASQRKGLQRKMSELKYKIKGNESFPIREGWLSKGMFAIKDNPYIFSDITAMDCLGVGSKMVKSIKYWLLASNLAEEKREKNSKHFLVPTEELGTVIGEHDPYFEDDFTLWILHYYISSNLSFNTVWYLFFNCFRASDFTKTSMVERITEECNKLYQKGDSLKNAIDSDCGVLLKMYAPSRKAETDPEENLLSPFSELGLLSHGDERGIYQKNKPIYTKLDPLAVLYVIVSNMSADKQGVAIESLLTEDNNIGKIFQLDRNMTNDYLDRLRQEGYIQINRTAGLDMIYIKEDITPKEILGIYYKQNETEV